MLQTHFYYMSSTYNNCAEFQGGILWNYFIYFSILSPPNKSPSFYNWISIYQQDLIN